MSNNVRLDNEDKIAIYLLNKLHILKVFPITILHLHSHVPVPLRYLKYLAYTALGKRLQVSEKTKTQNVFFESLPDFGFTLAPITTT